MERHGLRFNLMEELASRFGQMDALSGFLNASDPPLVKLDDPYYAGWEEAIELLPSLLLACHIRQYIDCRVRLSSRHTMAFYVSFPSWR